MHSNDKSQIVADLVAIAQQLNDMPDGQLSSDDRGKLLHLMSERSRLQQALAIPQLYVRSSN